MGHLLIQRTNLELVLIQDGLDLLDNDFIVLLIIFISLKYLIALKH